MADQPQGVLAIRNDVRVMVETLRLTGAERIRDEPKREFGATAEIGIYRFLCQLTGREV